MSGNQATYASRTFQQKTKDLQLTPFDLIAATPYHGLPKASPFSCYDPAAHLALSHS